MSLPFTWLVHVDDGWLGITALCLPWVGVLIGLAKGGYFLLNHYTTRILLRRSVPWNLVCFLDAASKRIFLRKVGGGYIFVHRTLLEYFARTHGGGRPQPAAARAQAAQSSR